MSSTEDRLRQLIDKHLNLDRAPDFDAQLSDAGVPSADVASFFAEVEESFDITLTAEDLMEFRTMRDLVAFIDARAG